MHRRARIKAVANLSAARRPASKSSSDVSNKKKECETPSEKEIEECEDKINSKDFIKSSDSLPVNKPADNLIENISTEKEDTESLEVSERDLTEKCQGTTSQVVLPDTIEEAEELNNSSESSSKLQHEEATFKTPLQMPRVDGDSFNASTSVPSSTKHRRFKIAPRLVVSRNSSKVDGEDVEKVEESQKDSSGVNASSIVETSPDFTLTKPRQETPREVSDQPNFIVNHNIQHSGAPPSPFPYLSHGHSRIRTESLCSMKSNRDVTVANLQPRKNIRTEDQKIIDIKRESRERLSNKDLDKSKLTMFDMIYFNPLNNPMKPRDAHKTEKPKKVEVIPEVVEKKPEVKKEPSSIPVPQLRIDANGDMVLDEKSLVVENEQQKQNRILLATTDVVYDDELSGNYGHYKRQQRTKEWQQDETVKFYRCLNTVGSDFSLMLNLFPNRSRRDLKLKFKKEEKINPKLINKALLEHNTFDLDGLQREFKEEEDRKKEAEEKSSSDVKALVKNKILKRQEAKLRAEQRTNSNIKRILTEGDVAMEMVNSLDLKENLELSIASSSLTGSRKRQYKKTVKKSETVKEESDDIATVSFEKNTSAPKKPRQTSKKHNISDLKQESVNISHLFVVPHTSEVSNNFKAENHAESSIIDSTDTLIDPGCSSSSMAPHEDESTETQTQQLESEVFPEVVEDLPGETEIVQLEKVDSTLEQNLSQDRGEHQNEAHVTQVVDQDFQMNEFDAPIIFCDTLTFVDPFSTKETELPVSSAEVVSLPYPTTSNAESPKKSNLSSPGKKSEKKPKQRKKKIRPVLVSRLKLDQDGEMVLDDSSPISSEEKSCVTASDPMCEAVPQTNELEPTSTSEDIEEMKCNEIPVDENLNETIFKSELSSASVLFIVPEENNPTSSSSCEEPVREEFDGEAFLDSLDLERLVLVEAQRDGKDVYEIHEIDPETQEIGEKPLDLPSRYVDLILSVMTQQEEEDN